MAGKESDADAKKFQPEPGKASIYMSRGMGIGVAVVVQTQLDGRVIGEAGPGTYELVSVAPGHHTVAVAGMENVEMLPG